MGGAEQTLARRVLQAGPSENSVLRISNTRDVERAMQKKRAAGDGRRLCGRSAWAGLAAMALAAAPAAFPAAALLSLGGGTRDAWAASTWASAGVTETLDRIILRNGKVIEGEILSESPTEVEMIVVVAGIRAPSKYARADILQIVRGEAAAEGEKAAEETPEPNTPGTPGTPGAASGLPGRLSPIESPATGDGTPKVYFFELTGEFATDISPTPIRDAMQDARKYEPDFIVVRVDNTWSADPLGEESDDTLLENPDDYRYVEDIEPVFRTELDEWAKRPQVIFWVRNAMGGACFLPFLADKIYFHPEGRMGGLAALEDIFEGVGDEVVRQKQRSLRLGRMQGIAVAGGYDYRLVTAMLRRGYELSYRLTGGRAELFEGVPSEPGEFLLTDNGKEENRDTMQQAVKGTLNDLMLLKEREAKLLGVSEGTADTFEDVLAQLGLERRHELIKGRGNDIMESWSESVARAARQMPKLWEEYQDPEVTANSQEDLARRTIGRRIKILEELRSIYNRYGEAIEIQRQRVPGPTDIDVLIEQLEVQLVTMR